MMSRVPFVIAREAEPGIGPEANALKELREETGYLGAGPRLMGSLFADSGLMDAENFFVHAAIVGRQASAPEATEAITRTVLLSIDEVWSAIASGEIKDSFTVQALALWAGLGAGT